MLIQLYWTWILLQKKQNYIVWEFLSRKKSRTLILWEMSTFQHFSNTVIFKKSPNSCSQAAFLASSIRHNAKTQQRECLLLVYTHHVYNTRTLVSVDSSRGRTASSALHFHGFSEGLGHSELAVSQGNHNSTTTRRSFLLCGASPQQRFGEHNVFF